MVQTDAHMRLRTQNVIHVTHASISHLNSASTVGPRDTNAYSISPSGMFQYRYVPQMDTCARAQDVAWPWHGSTLEHVQPTGRGLQAVEARQML